MHALPEGGQSPQGVLTAAPLAGQRVLVTRPASQSAGMRRALERLGARVTAIPTIRIDPPTDPVPLETAAASLRDYDWVVLTSVNGVERLAAAAERVPGGPGAWREARIAAIGPATAAAARAAGAAPSLVPGEYRAEALAAALAREAAAEGRGLAGVRVLLARAEEAREVLPDRLAEAGACVDVVTAYRTRVNQEAGPRLLGLIEAGAIDWLTFTASSTVRGFVQLVGPQTGGARIAAIGPVTARTVVAAGLPVHAVGAEYTTRGLIDALVDVVRGGPATAADARA